MDITSTASPNAPDRFCEHGVSVGTDCGRCAALVEMTANGEPRDYELEEYAKRVGRETVARLLGFAAALANQDDEPEVKRSPNVDEPEVERESDVDQPEDAGVKSDGVTWGNRLFASATELGVPPNAPGDEDLSRIQVTVPASLEEYERLHAEMTAARAQRKARYDRINGSVDLAGLGAL